MDTMITFSVNDSNEQFVRFLLANSNDNELVKWVKAGVFKDLVKDEVFIRFLVNRNIPVTAKFEDFEKFSWTVEKMMNDVLLHHGKDEDDFREFMYAEGSLIRIPECEFPKPDGSAE